MPTYQVEITGWDSYGESVEDGGTFTAPTEEAAIELLLNLMRARWDFTEVGDCRVYRLASMEDAFVRPKSYTELFEQHAAPEAIQTHIDKARERQVEIMNDLGYLEGLYLRRLAERTTGQWPVLARRGEQA